MLSSLFIYGFMAVSMYALASVYTERRGDTLHCVATTDYRYNMAMMLLIFIFFAGVRYDVGIDHLMYLNFYEQVQEYGDIYSRDDLEVGYIAIMQVLTFLGAHFSVYFAVFALMQIGFTYLGLRKHLYLLPFVGFLIMTGGIFFNWMNGMRQGVACAVLYAAIPFLLDRKPVKYFLCILLAALIHKSILIMMPLYFLTYIPFERFRIKQWLQFLLLAVAYATLQLNVWQNLLQYADAVFYLMGYAERFSAESLEINSRISSFGARSIIWIVITIIIILYSPRLRETYKDKFFGFFYFLFVLFFTIQPMFQSSMQFARIAEYFMFSRIVISAYLLFYLFKLRPTLGNKSVGLFVLLLYAVHLFIQIYSDSITGNDCIIYHFFWNEF